MLFYLVRASCPSPPLLRVMRQQLAVSNPWQVPCFLALKTHFPPCNVSNTVLCFPRASGNERLLTPANLRSCLKSGSQGVGSCVMESDGRKPDKAEDAVMNCNRLQVTGVSEVP